MIAPSPDIKEKYHHSNHVKEVPLVVHVGENNTLSRNLSKLPSELSPLPKARQPLTTMAYLVDVAHLFIRSFGNTMGTRGIPE